MIILLYCRILNSLLKLLVIVIANVTKIVLLRKFHTLMWCKYYLTLNRNFFRFSYYVIVLVYCSDFYWYSQKTFVVYVSFYLESTYKCNVGNAWMLEWYCAMYYLILFATTKNFLCNKIIFVRIYQHHKTYITSSLKLLKNRF